MTAPSLLAAARVIAVDRVTAEVAVALDRAGVDWMLLKGPALAHALYGVGEVRSYGDTDVLVDPRQRPLAIPVLQEAGFKAPPPAAYRDRIEPHGIHLRRERDGANVDLHRTLPLVRVDPAAVWDALRAGADRMTVAGAEVNVPSRPALAFHVALHAAHHGTSGSAVHEDLRRALAAFGEDVWRGAHELARHLDAVDAFARGLAFRPEGAALAARLRLPAPRSRDVALAAQGPPVTARGWNRLLGAHDRRERLRALRAALLPPPAYVRLWWGYRRRPNVPLPVMYAWRLGHLVRDAPGALAAVRRARRESVGG